MPFKYYAVHKGLQQGVFTSWSQVKPLIYNYKGAIYRGFNEQDKAEEFVRNGFVNTASTTDNKISKKKKSHPAPKQIEDENTIVVYTDGSCYEQGTPEAHAGIGIYWGPDHEWNVAARLQGSLQTNNRAEATAVLITMEKFIEHYADTNKKLLIRSDSQLVINSVKLWMEGWLKNGWTKSDGQPVLNVDILQKILPLYRMYKDRIDLEYVAAHVGHAENEIADSLAKAGARKENIQQHI